MTTLNGRHLFSKEMYIPVFRLSNNVHTPQKRLSKSEIFTNILPT